MKKSLWLGVAALALLLGACSKENDVPAYDADKQFALDSTAIINYLSEHALTATYDPSGVFYNVTTPGTGDSVKLSNNTVVTVYYKGQFLNGTVFDSTMAGTPFSTPLGKVILGWGLGLRHTQKGGSIRIYIPSYWGYGPYDYQGIPGNSPLIFDIQVVDVNNQP